MNVVRMSLAVVLLGAIGCATLQPVTQPAQFIPKNSPSVVYVTYTDNSIVPVAQPRMSGDTLFGRWQGFGEDVTIPLNQIQSIHAVQKDKKKTTLLIVGVSAIAAAATYALLNAGKGPGPGCLPSYAGDTHCDTEARVSR